jgi:serine protease
MRRIPLAWRSTVRTLRPYLIGILAAFTAATANVAAVTNETNPVRTRPPAAVAAVHLLVKLRAGSALERVQAQSLRAGQAAVSTNTIQALAVRANVVVAQTREIASGLHAVQIQPGAGESLASTLAKLKADPAVEFAEADQRRYPHALPNDPLFTGQWYLQSAQPAAIDALTAWDTTTGRADIVIADIDTGIRFDHPDLRSSTVDRLLPGYDFISDVAVANDGDGRDADASDPGDWVTTQDTQNPTFQGCTVENSSWHGTRTAGILGAIANNSTGISGITWQAKILPVRALGKCGGLDSDILDGMRWAAGLHVSGVPDNTHPAQVINMSLGGSGSCTMAEQTVINEVVAKGVVIVVSAGNEGGPVDSPANCVGVAGIAGLRNVGTKVGFSSLGPEVALSAPGGNCVNTSGACLFSIDTTVNTGTTTAAGSDYTNQLNPNLGTSFSAPIVSATAALMFGINGNLSPAALIARLKEGSKPFMASTDPTVPNCHVPTSSTDLQTTECNCTNQTCGAGMANAAGAVKAALRPIAAVTVPTAVTQGQNVVLKGTGSAAACGHTLSTYAWTNLTSNTNAIMNANTATATVVAPASGSFTVRLTVTDDAGKLDTADVVISSTAATTSAPAVATNTLGCLNPVAVVVGPATASVQANGGTQTFTATVTNTTNTAVTWQVNGVTGGNSTVGMISTSGVYTAPTTLPSPATVTVTAVAAADMNKSGSAQVTIVPAISVSVAPGTSTVTAGTGSQAFTATVANSTNTAVTWRVNGVSGGNSTVGTISAMGMYMAPATVPSPATVTISAVSSADSTRTGTAQVTIAPATAGASGSGSGSSSGGSSGGGSGGGGGAMDGLTLIAGAFAVGLAWRGRQRRHVV